jgi:hypothetical protein
MHSPLVPPYLVQIRDSFEPAREKLNISVKRLSENAGILEGVYWDLLGTDEIYVSISLKDLSNLMKELNLDLTLPACDVVNSVDNLHAKMSFFLKNGYPDDLEYDYSEFIEKKSFISVWCFECLHVACNTVGLSVFGVFSDFHFHRHFVE